MRIAVCFLYADIYKKLDAEFKTKVRKKLVKLAKDDTPMVRRAAAQSIPLIAKHLEQEHAQEFLLPVLKGLLEDANDSVKINAVAGTIDVAKAVGDATMLADAVFPSFRAACENRFSWRLRFAVAESAAVICSFVSKERVNEDVVNFYELLLRDSEPEVRSEALNKMPQVAVNCDPQVLSEKILPIIKEQLCSDTSQHVKGSLASAICELTEFVPRKDAIEEIFPAVINILTKESVTEVRVSLLESLPKLA